MKKTLREIGLFAGLGCSGLLAAPAFFFMLFFLFAGEGTRFPSRPEGSDLVIIVVSVFFVSATSLRVLLWWKARQLASRPQLEYGRAEDGAKMEFVVYALRQRATRLRRASNVILTLVVISVLLGFRVFTSAGYITSRDETATLDRLSERTMFELQRATEALRESKGASPSDVDRLTSRFSAVEAATADQIKAIREAFAAPNMMSVWSTISTRIASVLLLLFLVQILVTMYRYSIRLAAFYDARADILQLSPPLDSIKFEDIVRALSPDALDFGREPKSPAQHAIDLAKELIKGRASAESSKQS